MTKDTSGKGSGEPGRPRQAHRRPLTLQAVVGEALDRRADSIWPVSVADVVNAARTALPACDLTDDELADLVAIAALERGRNVAFDRDLLRREEAREPVSA